MISRLSRAPLWAALVLGFAASLHAIDYHFSAAGDDSNGNGTQANPWSTITKANTLDLNPGDRLLFRGGDTFTGKLDLTSEDSGTAASPVTVRSYGTGRATLSGGAGVALHGRDVSHVNVENLKVTGSGRSTNASHGVLFESLTTNATVRGLAVTGLEITGFKNVALGVFAYNYNDPGANPVYADIRITDCTVYDNGTGIETWAQADAGGIRDVYIARCVAYQNPGSAVLRGNGIVLGSVKNGLIEYCRAYENGAESTIPAGPAGIWTYASDGVIIQFNEAYNNKTASSTDGDGFDIDYDSFNCVVQYNYSHGNDGAGYLLSQGEINGKQRNNIVRYNVSENDGRKNNYGGIHVYGEAIDTHIYGNTVYVSKPANTTPAALVVTTYTGVGTVSNLTIRNNIFITAGGARLIDVAPRQANQAGGVLLQNNLYWNASGAFTLRWGNTSYSTLNAWLNAVTGQERVGGTIVALNVDPQLTAPGQGGTIGDPSLLYSLQAYHPRSGSPVINAAMNLASLGIDAGPQDYRGAILPAGAGLDLGAIEAANLIPNGNIEAGMTGWANWGNTSAQTGQPHWGTQALRTGTGAGGAGNTITSSIVPGARYRLLAWGKLTALGDAAWIGFEFKKNGAAVSSPSLQITSTTWTQAALEFDAPADFDQAYAWVWKNAGSAHLWADDFDLVRVHVTPPADVTDGLVARWKFDETSGTVAADSRPVGAANSGSLKGAATWSTAGMLAGALNTGTTKSWSEAADSADYHGQAMSWTMWVNSTSAVDGNARGLLSKRTSGDATTGQRAFSIFTYTSGKLFVDIGTQRSDTGIVLGTGWKHVAVVFDGSLTSNRLKVYIDGASTPAWQGNPPGGITAVPDTTAKAHVGILDANYGVSWRGLIDDVRIYNRALTGPELMSLATP